jgi:hypothetical protein
LAHTPWSLIWEWGSRQAVGSAGQSEEELRAAHATALDDAATSASKALEDAAEAAGSKEVRVRERERERERA